MAKNVEADNGRNRSGHSWIVCAGMPGDAIAELDKLKGGLGLRYRDDLIARILEALDSFDAAVRSGSAKVLLPDEGGTRFNCYLPSEQIERVAKVSKLGGVLMDRRMVLAAILIAVRPDYVALARAGFAKKMAVA